MVVLHGLVKDLCCIRSNCCEDLLGYNLVFLKSRNLTIIFNQTQKNILTKITKLIIKEIDHIQEYKDLYRKYFLFQKKNHEIKFKQI